MKITLFSGIFRSVFVLGLLTGLFVFVISFFPYDVLSSTINRLASDGSVESFSQDLWRFLSRVFMFLGGGLSIVCVSALIYYPRLEPWMRNSLVWSGEFFTRTRNDVRVFVYDGLAVVQSGSERLLVLVLILAGLIPRLANLFIPMEFDEAYLYNAFASHSFWHVITDYHVPGNHVFLTIIVNFLVNLFGNHLWLMRLPSLLAGVLMAPVGYFTASRLYGVNSGILSGVFISFFPILVKYSVLVRGYAIISLFTLLIILTGDYVRKNKNRFAWVVFVMLCVMGFYTVPVMLLPVGAMYVWLLLSVIVRDVHSYATPFEFLKYYIVSGLSVVFITSFLYAPILLNPSNRLFGNRFVAPVGRDIYPSVIYLRLRETWSDWVNVIPDWVVLLGVAGLIASFALYKKAGTHKVPLQAAFLIWILGYSLAQRPDMETRMWVFFAAPLLIWSSSGLDGILKIVSSYTKTWQLDKSFAVGVLILSLISAGLLVPSIPERWAEKGSVESAVIYLKDNLREGDVVLTSTAFRAQLRYYFVFYEMPLKPLQPSSSFERAYIFVRSVGWSPESGDTLYKVAPKDNEGSSLVDINSSRIVQRYEDLAVYESYPVP